MKIKLLVLVVVAGGILFAVDRYAGPKPGGVVFGEPVSPARFEGVDDPQRLFAEIVETRLIAEMIDRFDIDTSDASVAIFVDNEAPQLGSADKARSDQQSAAALADALESVLRGKSSIEGAFADFGLQEFISEPDWQQMAQVNANDDAIAAMREFAQSDIAQVRQATVESLRPIYVSRMIRNSICNLPEQRARIAARLDEVAGADDDWSAGEKAGIENFECAAQANAYLVAVLADNVTVNDPSLSGYQSHVSLLYHLTPGADNGE